MPTTSVLQFLNFGDRYERRARLYPAVIAILPVIVCVTAVTNPREHLLTSLGLGGGTGAVLGLIMSHAARAFGKHFEQRLWKQCNGAPTTRWLRPSDTTHSEPQKKQWYKAIDKLTGLDISKAVVTESDSRENNRIIEDAIRQLRYTLRDRKQSRMVQLHNEEYGFARNLAGLRWVLVGTSTLGTLVCAAAFLFNAQPLAGLFVDGGLLMASIAALPYFPWYARQCADRYAESLLSMAVISAKLK